LLTLVLAPFIPFVTERVWSALFAGRDARPDSVHLAAWPQTDAQSALVDPELGRQVALVRRLVELGRAARAEAKVKTRQPLSRALISAPGWATLPEDLREQVRDELNVLQLARLADSDELVEVSVKPNFRVLGRRFGKRTQAVANAINAADVPTFVADYRSGAARVELDGEFVEISGEEVIVNETPRSGWAVAADGAETVALDLELTHELRLGGLLREIVRMVQDARKNAGLEVTDRIDLFWRVGGSPDPADAITTHRDDLAREVLALSVTEVSGNSAPDDATFSASDDDLGLTIWLRRAS
jgi:isoleucyl-tRNA synthetase